MLSGLMGELSKESEVETSNRTSLRKQRTDKTTTDDAGCTDDK